MCIDLGPYVAEGRTTARNKRASIAGDIFDSGMRAFMMGPRKKTTELSTKVVKAQKTDKFQSPRTEISV